MAEPPRTRQGYSSSRSGTTRAQAVGDLFVAPLERPRREKRVASAVTGALQWGANGRELLFQRSGADGMALFAGITWSASPEGSRFLPSIENGPRQRTHVDVALDWARLPQAR